MIMTTEFDENPYILILMDSSSLNFDDGSKNTWGSCDGNFNFNLVCITQLFNTW